jgi:hypothetical protein
MSRALINIHSRRRALVNGCHRLLILIFMCMHIKILLNLPQVCNCGRTLAAVCCSLYDSCITVLTTLFTRAAVLYLHLALIVNYLVAQWEDLKISKNKFLSQMLFSFLRIVRSVCTPRTKSLGLFIFSTIAYRYVVQWASQQLTYKQWRII